nr:MAG TPA: restriction enzyme [Caudoviricetes sp.]
MGAPIDITGQRFGSLTVIELVRLENGRRKWKCQCDCGNIVLRDAKCLRSGNTTSCGCKKDVLKDLTGQRFGRLTVVNRGPNKIRGNGKKRVTWECVCDCGNITFVTTTNLMRQTKSCGCMKAEKTSERFSAKLEGRRFGKLVVICRIGTQMESNGDQKSLWLCKCDCGSMTQAVGKRLLNGTKISCGCIISKGELEVKQYLIEKQVKYCTQKSYTDLLSQKGGRLRFDFGILNKNNEVIGLIEFQGIQHYKETGIGKLEREETDPLKREYCRKNNIPLLEIPYNQDYKILIDKFLQSIYANTVPSQEIGRCNDYPEKE